MSDIIQQAIDAAIKKASEAVATDICLSGDLLYVKPQTRWYSRGESIREQQVKAIIKQHLGAADGYDEWNRLHVSDRVERVSLLLMKWGADKPPIPSLLKSSLLASELAEMDIEPEPWLVDGLINAHGSTLLVGKPKVGKSFLCLQLAESVSRGNLFLGRKCMQGDVFYIDCEGEGSQFNERAGKRLIGNEHLRWVSQERAEVRTVKTGLIDQLQEWVDNAVCPRLIIIDPISWVTEDERGKDAFRNSTDNLRPIQKFAIQNHVCVLVVHHERKGSVNARRADIDEVADDAVFESYAGGGGYAAVTKAQLVFRNYRGFARQKKLHCRGRSYRDGDINMVLEWGENSRFELLGGLEEVRAREYKRELRESTLYKLIRQQVEENDGVWKVSPTELGMRAGINDGRVLKSKASALQQVLKEEGIVIEQATGGSKGRDYTFTKSKQPSPSEILDMLDVK